MMDTSVPLVHLLGFPSLLRRAGFFVAPEQSMAWLAGIELLGPTEIGDLRRAARATLAPPPERLNEFDALFDGHFLGTLGIAVESAPSEDVSIRAADDSSGGPEPIFGNETHESGEKPTGAERLAARRFSPGGELEILRRFSRALPAHAPRRRGYRWRGAPRGPGADARRMFRDAMRTAGEFVRLRRRKRRMRQRRIVLLVDISGSMKERTHTHLAFAHALARAADSAEVFTIGTRLTRVTRALRQRNRQRALASASNLVADWDGGTRIGEALGAFLSIPRFASLARGAALVVLSDGLERGDPSAMREAVAHLSRIAWRTVWLTPLAGDKNFEPRTAGLAAVWPFLDELGDGGSLDSICAHVLELAREKPA